MQAKVTFQITGLLCQIVDWVSCSDKIIEVYDSPLACSSKTDVTPFEACIKSHYEACKAGAPGRYMHNRGVSELLIGTLGVDANPTDSLRTLYSHLNLPEHSEDCLCKVPFSLWKGANPGPSDYLIGGPGSNSPPHVVSVYVLHVCRSSFECMI